MELKDLKEEKKRLEEKLRNLIAAELRQFQKRTGENITDVHVNIRKLQTAGGDVKTLVEAVSCEIDI